MEPRSMENDVVEVMNRIDSHELKDEIVQWYLEGPPDNLGFMWCRYDTPAKKYMQQLVGSMGYDSSAYGVMHRNIQVEVRKREAKIKGK